MLKLFWCSIDVHYLQSYDFFTVQSWSCTHVYSRPDQQPILPFHADIESSGTIVTYKIYSPFQSSFFLGVSYFNGKQFGALVVNNCTFIGRSDLGELIIKLEKPYPGDSYKLEKTRSGSITTEQCFTVYVLGRFSVIFLFYNIYLVFNIKSGIFVIVFKNVCYN